MPAYMVSATRFDPAEIVGGQIAPSPIPWQVSLQSGGSHFCAATILDDSTLLSAAHCFDGFSPSYQFTIRAGSRKWSSGGQV